MNLASALHCFAILIGLCHGMHGGRHRRFGKRVRDLKRQVSVNDINGTTKEFEVRPDDQSVTTKAKIGFHIRPFPSFRTLIFNNTDDSMEVFGYRVNLLRLAEVGEDTNALNSTNTVDLVSNGNTWSFASTLDRTVNNTVIKTMQATFTSGRDSDPKASVTLSAELALGEVEDRGHSYKPSALKWSMNISDFPYSDTADTKLAFLVSVNSKQGREASLTEDGAISDLKVGSGNGTFSWTPTVLADEISRSLTVTDLGIRTDLEDDGDDFKFNQETATYLQFTVDDSNKPREIYWDPENDTNEDQVLGNEEVEDGSAGAKVGVVGFLSGLIALMWLL